MKGLIKAVGEWFGGMSRVFARTLKLIFSDFGVMLFFFALPLGYPIVYTLIYLPQVVREMPTAVIDHSHTEASRKFIRTAEASPSISIYKYCNDLNEAKQLFAENKVYGIIEIPADYEQRIMRGEQATVPFYAEVSLLLRYRAYLSAMTDLQLKLVTDITSERLDAAGMATGASLPVESHNTFLGVPSQGFASFIMPGIVILIIQQSMLLGICMMAGTSRDRSRRHGGVDPLLVRDVPDTARIWGRAFAFVLIYIPMVLYVTRWIPEMFDLPHIGDPADYLLFMLPMLLASAMFGMTVQGFCTERESCFVIVVVTSVVFLFLSGLTWPRYAMNGFWRWLSNVVPATWGVDGFVCINSNGATLAEVGYCYKALWALTAAWFVAAWWVTSRLGPRVSRRVGLIAKKS